MKVILLAGGYGTRMSEYTDTIPKPMVKIGGFPIMEVFANAKIKQTRLFIKAEHFNSTITGNNFYSSPSYPYRDFIIRFGLVWNFFN